MRLVVALSSACQEVLGGGGSGPSCLGPPDSLETPLVKETKLNTHGFLFFFRLFVFARQCVSPRFLTE